MLVYHYLTAAHGLENIRRRRIKIAELRDLNDPFELSCYALDNRRARREMESIRNEIGRRYGWVCFSSDWRNPVLWSHYADKHKGMCLGFDVPDEKIVPVRYTSEKLQPPSRLSE